MAYGSICGFGRWGYSEHIKVVFVVVVVVESIVPFHQNTQCLVVALHIGLLWLRIGEIITAALITMDF